MGGNPGQLNLVEFIMFSLLFSYLPAAIVWDVAPGFDIFFISPRWYGLLFAAGFIIGYLIMEKFFKFEQQNTKDLDPLSMYMVISTIIGARLGHCLFYAPDYYLSNPIEIIKVWEGGLASHGGAIGILIGLFLFVRRHPKYTYLCILDRIAIVAALAGSFIRLGNFFNSEIYGYKTDVPWAVIFKKVDDIPRHPVQMYESISYMFIFFVLLLIYNRYKGKTPSGLLLGLFMFLIFGVRLIMEIWKIEQADFNLAANLKVGQILSIPFVIVGAVLIIRALRKR